MGCFPGLDKARCILKADKGFDTDKVDHYYYTVRDREIGLIGNDGELKTGFDYDEMYDASEAYIASMGGRGAFYG